MNGVEKCERKIEKGIKNEEGSKTNKDKRGIRVKRTKEKKGIENKGYKGQKV